MKNGSLLTVVLLFVFTNSFFAQFPNSWNVSSNGLWNVGTNWTGGVPENDDVIIAMPYTVTYSTTEPNVESVFIENGGSLIIDSGTTLTTFKNEAGGDAIRLSDSGSSLTVNGTINTSDHSGDGLDQNAGCTVTIGASGSYIIDIFDTDAIGDEAIEIGHTFSNAGSISILNTGGTGLGSGIALKAEADGDPISNSGSITISDVYDGIIFDSGTEITNTGTVTISSASHYLIDGNGSFINNGTFKGDGTINSANFNFGTGTLAPGTSIGTITFTGSAVTFTDASTIEMEIDGASSFDKILVTGNCNLNNVDLTLTGTYTPVMDDVFTLIDVTAGTLSGTFDGIGEGDPITYDGTKTLYISYVGGDGNDVTASFNPPPPLPVELIDFNARAMEGEVKVSWTTANEENNDYFTLERSPDGRNFEAIAMVFGNGNTTEISKYTHMDKDPRRGLSYYRLKQTDYDGTFTYSDIETVEFEEDAEVQVYPTVAHEVLNVVFGGDLKNDQQVVIRDLTGREYKSFVISSNKSKNEISLSDLVPGSYFVAIYDNEKVTTFKIIKL